MSTSDTHTHLLCDLPLQEPLGELLAAEGVVGEVGLQVLRGGGTRLVNGAQIYMKA